MPEMITDVSQVFDAYPPPARTLLYKLRRLILETAAALPEAGEITETLKWGQPAYLTEQTKSGSTIRLGWRKAYPDECAIFFHCGTSLVEDFREMFGDTMRFEGNRAILLSLDAPLARDDLKTCITAALLYHLRK